MKNSPSFIIFFLALLCAVSVHWLNHSYLLDVNPSLLREGVSVVTQDDPSYLAPVENALAGKGWRSNAAGNAAYVTRTPGYGLVYAAFRVWLPEKAALIGLLGFQFLLFALSASIVSSMFRLMAQSSIWAFWVGLAYAVMPMFSGFLSYTLTEGVTPALVIFFMYFVLMASKGSQKFYWWSAAVLSMLIIIRPPLVVLLLVYPLQLVFESWKLNWKRIALAVSISLFPFMLWQIYGYSKTHKLPGLHAIYHDDASGLYRPVHEKLWNFHKSWGQDGAEFHNDVNGLWQAALNNEPPRKAIDQLMGHLPKGAIEAVGVERLEWAYESYYQVLKAQKPHFESGEVMVGQTALELSLGDSLGIYTSLYRSANWFDTWVSVPTKVYWNLAAHSNMSLYVFQNPWRGNLFVEALRWISFLVHLGVFMLFPVVLVLKIRSKAMLIIGIPIAFYLIYLCFIQRGVEERYTLPFLLPMLVFVKVYASDFIHRPSSKNEKTY